MRNIYRTIGVCLLTAAISFTMLSCKKKEPVAPPPTPEQKAAIEEMKKDAETAKTVFAARVNGVEISMYDLVREMNRVSAKYIREGDQVDPKITAKIKQEAMDSLIFNELAVQEALRKGMKVSPEKIDEVVKLMKEQYGSKEAYQQYLDNLGITEEGLKKRIERSHLLEMITAQEIYQKVMIDEKELLAEYDRNKSAFKMGERQLSYDEASTVIKKRMISERGAEMKKGWGKALRKNAKIVIAKDVQK